MTTIAMPTKALRAAIRRVTAEPSYASGYTQILCRRAMPPMIITVGDKTDHGGTVISGSPTHDILGRAIARLGDLVDCPQSYPGGKPHGVNKIITACNSFTVNGVPVAVDGCTTECGCKLIGSLAATAG